MGQISRTKTMLSRLPWHSPPLISASTSTREVLGSLLTDILQSSCKFQQPVSQGRRVTFSQGSVKFLQTSCRIPVSGVSVRATQMPSKILKDKKMVPKADPPSIEDVNRLYQFFDQSTMLLVLTGAGIGTECGIPDYRSRARRRYWARSYAGWRRFSGAQPGAAHVALASLEKAGQIHFMITQNIDRLHHRARSNPLELHGTVYSVICLDCGFSFCRNLFQDEVKALNPKCAAATESLDYGSPGSYKSFGMKQRPDGDIEIDEKFWEEDFHIPTCQKCKGTLKPDVRYFTLMKPDVRYFTYMNNQHLKCCE